MIQVLKQMSKKIKIQHIILTLVIIGLVIIFVRSNKKDNSPFDIPTSFQEQKSQFYDIEIQDNMTVMVGETKYYSFAYTKNDFDNDKVEDDFKKIMRN